MTIRLNPYLSFRDEARGAMEHYQKIFGGELTLTTFGEAGLGEERDADKVMHSMLETDEGLVLMASDTPPDAPHDDGSGVSVSLSEDDEAALSAYWDGLSDGGTVLEPLTQAPWGDSFGMCIDRFGVSWMVNIASAG